MANIFSKYGNNILHTKNHTKTEKYPLENASDGELYKKKRNKDTININFNYDGVPIFKSSTFSAHPILCSIVEITPKNSGQNIILTALWFGRKKPKVNSFFVPFVNECKNLHENGFKYTFDGKEFNKKVRVLIGVCDSIARCDVKNTSQFNGKNGCGLCKHPGVQVSKGRGSVRVYPIKYKNVVYTRDLRSHEETVNFDEENSLGVKGRSILCDIPDFDIIDNLPPDWMHCVGLGVCRQFAKMWFKEYFPLTELEVSKLLSKCKPISGIRPPRSMTDRKNWKAHEWVAWLLYFSLPILKKVLPAKYVEHWALLVKAIFILLKSSIMKSEVYKAEKMLLNFVEQIPELYDVTQVSFNVHLLTHLSSSVLKWGPLWTHSAFIYENYNQQILNTIKKSQQVALQICKAYRLKSVVHYLFDMMYKKFSEEEQLFLDHILYNTDSFISVKHVDGICINSSPNYNTLSREYFIAFQRNNVSLQDKCDVSYYEKIIVQNEIIQSVEYTKVRKRNNFTVQLLDGKFFEIQIFAVLKVNSAFECYAIGRYFTEAKFSLLQVIKLDHLIGLDKKDKNFTVVRAQNIKRKIVILPFEDTKFVVCIPPSNIELLS